MICYLEVMLVTSHPFCGMMRGEFTSSVGAEKLLLQALSCCLAANFCGASVTLLPDSLPLCLYRPPKTLWITNKSALVIGE